MSRQSLLSTKLFARSGADSEGESDDGSPYGPGSLKRRVQFAGFWAAVGLPFVHIALLVRGLTSAEVVAAFVVLLVLNVVALYVGHDYEARR